MEVTKKNIFSVIVQKIKSVYQRISQEDIPENDEQAISSENFPQEDEKVIADLIKSQNEEVIKIVNEHSGVINYKAKKKTFEEKYAPLQEVVYKLKTDEQKLQEKNEYSKSLEKNIAKEERE